MKTLIWTLTVATLAVVAALLAAGDHGQVVLFVARYRVDLSLNLLALIVLAVAVLCYWFGRLAQELADFPEKVRVYQRRRVELAAQRSLRDAVKALFEGRFARAERAAGIAARAGGVPPVSSNGGAASARPAGGNGVAALLGARAAHRLQQYERRDQWLERAAADPEMNAARLVASAEMWAESREPARALEAVEALQAKGARHIHALRTALNIRAQARQWRPLAQIVRQLEKHKALHPLAAVRLKRIAYLGQMRDAGNDAALVDETWRKIPAADRADSVLAGEGARLLNAVGRSALATAAIEAALAEDWDERLLDVYAECGSEPALSQLEHAEAWWAEHPASAAVARCLGILCLRRGLWGKARIYLDESLRLEPGNAVTHLAAARLAEQVENAGDAAMHYRSAALAGVAAPQLAARGDLALRGSPRDILL